MTIGKTDAELVGENGHTSRLYSACKRLAWASAISLPLAVLSLSLVFSEKPQWARYLPAILIVAFCLGAFLWGILWPRSYSRRRKSGQWIICLITALLLFLPTMILSIGSTVALKYVNIDFDYATPTYQTEGYPVASFLAREYIPLKATGIRFKGNTGIAWSVGASAAFTCEIPEEDFLAFAKANLYELHREDNPRGIDLPAYRRFFPEDNVPVFEHSWIYRIAYGNGGGVVLVYDLEHARLYGEFRSN